MELEKQQQIIEMISREETRLIELDNERQRIIDNLERLRHQLASIKEISSPVRQVAGLSPLEKIALFRSQEFLTCTAATGSRVEGPRKK